MNSPVNYVDPMGTSIFNSALTNTNAAQQSYHSGAGSLSWDGSTGFDSAYQGMPAGSGGGTDWVSMAKEVAWGFVPGSGGIDIYDAFAAGSIGLGVFYIATELPILKPFKAVYNFLKRAGKKVERFTPDRVLPNTKHGDPIPDVDLPHSQLGRNASGNSSAREWMPKEGGGITATRRIDFTDHGTPDIHPNPHQHRLVPNNYNIAPRGGYSPAKAEPLEY